MNVDPNRTQDEILARIRSIDSDDVFGFSREVLLTALDYEHVKPYLKDGLTAADWPSNDIEGDAREYLEFAVGKIIGHRGISAERSVSKLAEYAWLLGRDDVVDAMGAADYAQYGAPKVKAFADGLGWSFNPDGDAELNRMADGLPCIAGCDDGCAR